MNSVKRSEVVTDVKRVIKRRRNLVVISERVPSAGGSRPRRRRLARGSADLDSSGRGLLLVDSCPALGSPGARALGLGCVGAPQPRSSPVLPVLLHGTSRLLPRAVQAPCRRAPSIPRRPYFNLWTLGILNLLALGALGPGLDFGIWELAKV